MCLCVVCLERVVCEVRDVLDVLADPAALPVWTPALMRFISNACTHFQSSHNSRSMLQFYNDPLLHCVHAAYLSAGGSDYDSCDEDDQNYIRWGSQYFTVPEGVTLAGGVTSTTARCRFVNASVPAIYKLMKENKIGSCNVKKVRTKKKKTTATPHSVKDAEVASVTRILKHMMEAKRLTHETVLDIITFSPIYFNVHRFISVEALVKAGYHTGPQSVINIIIHRHRQAHVRMIDMHVCMLVCKVVSIRCDVSSSSRPPADRSAYGNEFIADLVFDAMNAVANDMESGTEDSDELYDVTASFEEWVLRPFFSDSGFLYSNANTTSAQRVPSPSLTASTSSSSSSSTQQQHTVFASLGATERRNLFYTVDMVRSALGMTDINTPLIITLPPGTRPAPSHRT